MIISLKNMGKSTFIAFFLIFSLWCSTGFAQKATPSERMADRLTLEMGAALNLPEGTLIQVKKYNRERLTKLMALSTQAHQLRPRDLELRVDEVEQHYNQRMFSLLNAQQYIQYKRFRENRVEFTRPSQALASAMGRLN
ncbi:hypothetical protein [Rufibacter ruber]|uniref:hypothetical protein n=1 Tax=Rufibacter ruber TaxID=1783499 RepID=UPI000836098A|nr:hypothetical protein [Rufibacter ruber]